MSSRLAIWAQPPWAAIVERLGPAPTGAGAGRVLRMRSSRLATPAASMLLAAMLVISAAPARAQQQRAIGPTPPRLAFMEGDVSFWREGADDWAAAQVNTPLAAGDELYAPDGANFEIAVASRAYVRGGADTQLGILSLETGYLQLQARSG